MYRTANPGMRLRPASGSGEQHTELFSVKWRGLDFLRNPKTKFLNNQRRFEGPLSVAYLSSDPSGVRGRKGRFGRQKEDVDFCLVSVRTRRDCKACRTGLSIGGTSSAGGAGSRSRVRLSITRVSNGVVCYILLCSSSLCLVNSFFLRQC
jgi:hypothetical protein